MFEAPEKHSLGHLRAVKQLKTVALDLEEVRELILRPQSIQLHISRIFHVSKQNDRDTWSNGDHSFKQKLNS